MYERALFSTQTHTAAVNLIRAGAPLTRKVVLLGGAAYAVGSVLGTITANKKATLSVAAATDGSQAPDLVLAYDVDATGGDVEAMAYEKGDLVGEALVLGAGHTLASIREPLRDKGITISA
ncbi:head decoration protein [Sphingomonas sp. CFBP 8760]|uniref:head decoration protein n=1 Tax=Sphingomonas sp. CFBP 8760 TaxID=2775282 RepID=UPI00177BEC64|nr:head decoration protein [Sphingomonas sp. CFBP 8760]MBD8548011.1 head decoration protein [Sphingomonas sp. CFBP 8760]